MPSSMSEKEGSRVVEALMPCRAERRGDMRELLDKQTLPYETPSVACTTQLTEYPRVEVEGGGWKFVIPIATMAGSSSFGI